MAIYKDIVKTIPISAEKKTKQKQYLSCGVLPIIDQGQQIIGGYTDDISKKIDCDLPVIVFGDHTRCVKLIKFAFAPGADGIKVVRPIDNSVLIEYLFYATKYLATKIRDKGYARHYQDVEKQELEIPTVLKQKEIVLKSEKNLSSLDNAVETLNKTKEQLAVYRQAVLKEAFEGIDTCVYKEITSLCDNIVDCPHSTPKWVHNGKLCLRTTNFRRGYLDLSEKNYVSVETYNERITRLKPESGDVLFSREGAILGLACIIPSGLEICMGQRMMLLRPSKEMNNRYLMHYLNSPISRQLIVENVGGSASPHINVGDIKRFKIPFVNRNKQEEIVSMVDARLSLCDSIEATVDNALAKAEAMRQSILKEAFES